MKRRLGLNKLIVDPLQHRVVALRKRIMNRFFNRVVRIAHVAIDVGNRVADRARNPGLRSRMIQHVELRIIEGSTEERDRVMTARTEA